MGLKVSFLAQICSIIVRVSKSSLPGSRAVFAVFDGNRGRGTWPECNDREHGTVKNTVILEVRFPEKREFRGDIKNKLPFGPEEYSGKRQNDLRINSLLIPYVFNSVILLSTVYLRLFGDFKACGPRLLFTAECLFLPIYSCK